MRGAYLFVEANIAIMSIVKVNLLLCRKNIFTFLVFLF
jgi:hypothetical protein